MLRTTRILQVDPDSPSSAVLDEAAAVLRAGGLVAFATETVYGLGADATNPAAVAGIYEAKGRPPFNPLIVHAHNLVTARSCVSHWPETAELLARAFWPGPLTLVLPRSALIPDIVTAGRETVGIRIPRPTLTRALIDRTGRPLAAPSANRSSGVSPTLATHVLADLNGRIDLILDSGQTTLGLESTVLDLTSSPPRILRPGPVSAHSLEQALGGLRVLDEPESTVSDRPASPGQLAIHYAPRAPAFRIDDPRLLATAEHPESTALILCGAAAGPGDGRFARVYHLDTPERAAHALYRVLRECDDLGVEQIIVLAPADSPDWRAIRDRIIRATRPFAPRQ